MERGDVTAKARILAVDDQLYFRSFLEGLLTEAGYAVDVADSWDAGIARIKEAPYALVVTDVLCAPGDGAEAIAELCRAWPDQDVLIVSGTSDVGLAVAVLQAGACDFLTKPVTAEKLARAVARVLASRRAGADENRLVEENLEIIGRMTLIDRALGLLSHASAAEAAGGLLELFAAATRAGCGALWVPSVSGEWARAATRELAGDAATFDPEVLGISEALSAGRPVLDPPEAPTRLFAPLARAGRLVAVAELSIGDEGLGREALQSAGALGGVGAAVLGIVHEREQIGDSTFRDAATGLPTKSFLDEVARTEVQKAHRYGRRLSVLCIDLEGFDASEHPRVVPELVAPLARTLRTTDIVVSEDARRFWVLVTDTDPLGGVVLKRRIAHRMREALDQAGLDATLALGVASFPLDGERFPELCAIAEQRARDERASVIHRFGIRADTPLAEIGEKLLDRARWLAPGFVAESAELLLGELARRPRDRGLLFLAPGQDRASFLTPLTALGDNEASTDVFLATDGDTLPSGPAITALGLPPNVDENTTWIVRFGEAPPYALVAGPPRSDGARPVYHTCDPVLVEHMTFRLRAEIGFGVRA